MLSQFNMLMIKTALNLNGRHNILHTHKSRENVTGGNQLSGLFTICKKSYQIVPSIFTTVDDLCFFHLLQKKIEGIFYFFIKKF